MIDAKKLSGLVESSSAKVRSAMRSKAKSGSPDMLKAMGGCLSAFDEHSKQSASGGQVDHSSLARACEMAANTMDGDEEMNEHADALRQTASAARSMQSATGYMAADSESKTASLRSSLTLSSSNVKVNADKGIIANCAVMTAGPTIGHPFAIDQTTMKQTMALINAEPEGVKVRFRHQLSGTEDLGTVVGRLRNCRIEGDSLRGDVEIGDYAANLPGLGDCRAYLIDIAKGDPAALGLSAVIVWTPDRGKDGQIVARVSAVQAVDFVGKPAANPNGLLSAKEKTEPVAALAAGAKTAGSGDQTTQKGGPIMDPKLRELLVGLGLDPTATEDQAKSFNSSLSAIKQAELSVKAAELKAPPTPVQLEARRIEQITQLAALYSPLVAKDEAKLTALSAATLKVTTDSTLSVDQAKAVMLKAIETPAIQSGLSAELRVGDDKEKTAMLTALPEAVALRAGVAKIQKPHELAVKLASLSVIDMGRQYLASLGAKDVAYISRVRMAELLLSRRELRKDLPQVAMLAESVGDFASVLLDAMNKTFRPLYLDAPKTWPVWCRRATAPDFKNINRTALSEAGSLSKRDQGGEIRYVTITDGKEVYSLAEYVGGIKITRKAIINDDMDVFGRIPQLQANSCWRAEEEGVYGILTANATLSDTGALFNSTAITTAGGHANLVTGTANLVAPSVTSVGYMETLMLKQKGPKAKARLSLKPKFLITPVSIKVATEQFLTSANLIAVISTSSTAPQTVGQSNPYAGKLTHVYSPVLDDTSATNYYLAADYRDGQVDTIEIAFLDGEPEPVLRQETDFDTEDVKFAVRHTLAAKAIDHRGLVSNPST